MYFSVLIPSCIAFLAAGVMAAPLPQLAGEGAACNSILSSTDNGIGYGTENLENNLAKLVGGVHARQLAGEGAACDSVLSSTDNGVGYGVENLENNLAKTVSGVHPRQADKIAKGAQNLAGALGLGSATSGVTDQIINLDGTSTGGAANLGAQIGDLEASTLENLGNLGQGTGSAGGNGGGSGSPPPPPGPGPHRMHRRQADKMAKGAQNLAQALSLGSATSGVTDQIVNLDGTSTGGAANLGAQIGDLEASTLENLGNLGQGTGSAGGPPS